MRSAHFRLVHFSVFVAGAASIACGALSTGCGTASSSSQPEPSDASDERAEATSADGQAEARTGDATQPMADSGTEDTTPDATYGPDAGPDASPAGPDASGERGADVERAAVDAAQAGPDAAADSGADGAHPGPDASALADTGREDADTGPAVDAAAPGDAGGGPEQCTTRAPVNSTTWKLAWSDEFDKPGAPDPSNWGFEHGFVRNQELQWYQPDNATVAGGILTIAAQRQQVANPSYVAGSTNWTQSRQYAQYTSSSMTTSGKRSFTYGRFEMCGKIDVRVGSWPAFWILGNGKSWPSSGEVDIMEYYANEVRANVCKPSGSTCDWSGSVGQALSALGGTTWANQFHLWAMEWDTSHIGLYLDDKLVYDFVITSAYPAYTGTPFYMLVNLAIGANGGDPTNTTFPITYQVDYVRVYQH